MALERMRISKVVLGALGGFCCWIFLSAEVGAQTVVLVKGTVLAPPDLVEGQTLRVERDIIRLGSDGLVILSYDWPSDEALVSCTSYMIISGEPKYRVPRVSRPRDCTGGANPRKTLDAVTSGKRFVDQVTFYGDAKGDTITLPRHVSESLKQSEDFYTKVRNVRRPSRLVKPKGQQLSAQTSAAWTIDPTGVCRDAAGQYPRWSDYNWSLPRCEANCRRNPNCQGFAMSKTKNYCQLMGSDGSRSASRPGTRITRGDSSQPQYTCYLKR